MPLLKKKTNMMKKKEKLYEKLLKFLIFKVNIFILS